VSRTYSIPVRVFVVVSFPLSFSLEEVSGFSARACAPRQKGILAPFNPRSLESSLVLQTLLLPVTLWNFVPGVIAAVGISGETPVGRRSTRSNLDTRSLGFPRKRKYQKSIVSVAGEPSYPRGNSSTEYLARDSEGTLPLEYYGMEGWSKRIVRTNLGPGVLETLNPTDDGRFGNGRNTNEGKI
jgi:hypothetical protein